MTRSHRFFDPRNFLFRFFLLSCLCSFALAGTEGALYSFTGGADGNQPQSRLVMDAGGNLFGTTASGGSKGFGAVFELVHNADGTYTQKTLYSFAGGKDGEGLYSGLLLDSAGSLYGTTFVGGNVSSQNCQFGGDPGCGLVFKLSPNGDGTWTKTTLYIFQGGTDGSEPFASELVQDSAGVLYGTTTLGGINCYSGFPCGTAFSLTPNPDGTWSESVLYRFTGPLNTHDGMDPGPLTLDAGGNLYGITGSGGKGCQGGCGTIYRLNRQKGWAETVLYRFAGNKDGAFPNSALVFDGNGRLYGSTVLGGDTTAQDCIIVDNVSGCGTVFQLAISGGVARKAVLHTFTGAPDDGKYPSTLVLDDQHNLYSATEQGGNVGFGNGTIFELTREQTGWTENILYNFAGGTDAMRPLGGLVRDTTGNLYGTSQLGGDTSCGQGFGCGVVFRWSPQ